MARVRAGRSTSIGTATEPRQENPQIAQIPQIVRLRRHVARSAAGQRFRLGLVSSTRKICVNLRSLRIHLCRGRGSIHRAGAWPPRITAAAARRGRARRRPTPGRDREGRQRALQARPLARRAVRRLLPPHEDLRVRAAVLAVVLVERHGKEYTCSAKCEVRSAKWSGKWVVISGKRKEFNAETPHYQVFTLLSTWHSSLRTADIL